MEDVGILFATSEKGNLEGVEVGAVGIFGDLMLFNETK